MSKGTLIGFSMLVGGILIWIAYGFYLSFEELMKTLDFITGLVIGLIVIGLIVLFVTIFAKRFARGLNISPHEMPRLSLAQKRKVL